MKIIVQSGEDEAVLVFTGENKIDWVFIYRPVDGSEDTYQKIPLNPDLVLAIAEEIKRVEQKE